MSAAAQTSKAPEKTKKVVTLVGQVESDKRDKTRTVVVRYQSRHPKYGKYIRRQTVIQAHDESNASKIGDTVEIGPCRPVSKTKTWKVLRVVQVAAAPQVVLKD
jgi:small subunit ribosomal protein S17